MDRTIVLQLNPTHEQTTLLRQTLDQHTACFNTVATHGFTSQCSNGVQLHKDTYYPLRSQFPDLPAQLVCAARVKATEAVKSALTWKVKKEKEYPKKVAKAKKMGWKTPVFKPVKAPQSAICPIRYDARSYWVKWNTTTCSLATVDGRVEVPFTVPVHLVQYVGYKTCSADLMYRKGRFTLHVVVFIPQPDLPSTDDVIGIDLGLNRPAVTSEHVFLGERRWKEQERRIFRLKRKLAAKGTKSAKRHLKKLFGKLFRQRRDAATCGIRVGKVDPRYTSQTCSRCGFQHRSNRRSQSLFHCRSCGYQLNADLNAAYNIRDKFLTLTLVGTSFESAPQSIGVSSSDEGQAPGF
jgi:transposase